MDNSINTVVLETVNMCADELCDLPREAFPASLRESAQMIQADLIELRRGLIDCEDWATVGRMCGDLDTPGG